MTKYSEEWISRLAPDLIIEIEDFFSTKRSLSELKTKFCPEIGLSNVFFCKSMREAKSYLMSIVKQWKKWAGV